MKRFNQPQSDNHEEDDYSAYIDKHVTENP